MATVWCVGCGDIGLGVGHALAAAGMECHGFRRRPQGGTGIRQHPLDVLDDAESVRARLLEQAIPLPDYVIYTVTPSSRDEVAYRRAYDEGVANCLRWLPAPPKLFVLVSSTGVYGQDAGEWVDETSPTTPVSFSGRALLAGEQHVRTSGWPHTVVRLSGIYGPGRQRNLDRLRSGAPIVRTPPVYTNRIHREDAIGFLAFLIKRHDRGHTVADTFVASDNDPASEWEVMTWLAQWAGLPPPVEAEGQGSCNKRCNNARLRNSGYALAFPSFREGYADAFAPAEGQ